MSDAVRKTPTHVVDEEADEEVDATAADPRSADLLKVPHGAALLRIRQVLYSAGAEAIVYSLGLYRADRHSLLTRRFR